jgi:hypothetical protein
MYRFFAELGTIWVLRENKPIE